MKFDWNSMSHLLQQRDHMLTLLHLIPTHSMVFNYNLLHCHSSHTPTTATERTCCIYALLDDIHIRASKTDVRMRDAISCDPFVAVGDS